MSVDKLQEAEEAVAQLREEEARKAREALGEDLRRPPVADTAAKAHRAITIRLAQVRVMTNMRTGALEDLHELAVSIRETGLLHPPLVRETGEAGAAVRAAGRPTALRGDAADRPGRRRRVRLALHRRRRHLAP